MAEVPTGAPARSGAPVPAPRGEGEARSSTDARSLPWQSLIFEAVVLVLCVPLWVTTGAWKSSVGGPGPAFYPRLLIALLALAMVVRIVQDVLAARKGAPTVEEEAALEEGVEMDASLISMRRVAVVVALSVVYVWSTLWIGWVIATFAVVIVFLVLAGKRNPLVILPTALVMAVGFAYLFVKVVYISLPTGVGVFDEATVRLFELIGAY